MDAEMSEGADSAGVGVDDLPNLMRSVFDRCVQDAREETDPDEDLEGFLDSLWDNVEVAFNLTRQEWPDDLPRPWPVEMAEHRGTAESVLEGTDLRKRSDER